MNGCGHTILDELPLPLGADADVLEVLAIAVAVEDGCDVVLPDERMTADHLGTRVALDALLREMTRSG